MNRNRGAPAKEPRRTRKALELLRLLRPYTRPHRRYAVIIGICLFVGLPFAWAIPIFVKRVFDVAVPTGDIGLIVQCGFILAGITYVEALLSLARGACTTLFHAKALHRLRLDLYRTFQSLGLGFVQGKETGEIMSRLSDDVANLGGVMADRLAQAVNALVQIVVVGVILLTREWRLAAIAVGGALAMVGANLVFSRALRGKSREVRERGQELSIEEHQAVSGHALVRSSAAEPLEFRRYSRALGAAVRSVARRDFFGLWTGHPSVVLGGVFPGLVLLAGAAFIAKGSITQGDLFAIFIFLGQFFSAAATLGGMNPALQTSLASLDRIADLLAAGKTDRQPSGHRILEKVQGAVAFEDVRFGYGLQGHPEVPEILHGISFSATPGMRVAIVGKSGAGKTTLLSLIPRFFEPWSGRITIDGVPLAELEVHHLRRDIGIVPQDVFLFDRTVAENIAYARPDASPAEIEAAAEAASALEFIRGLPEGFQTRIGERGVRLSAGQRQRLAIARELLRAPAILILDEATSALDSETEREVQSALERLLLGRTSFVIAHRLSTVRRADLILVVEAGRLVASGTYDELLRDSPAFRELALLQSVGSEPAGNPSR